MFQKLVRTIIAVLVVGLSSSTDSENFVGIYEVAQAINDVRANPTKYAELIQTLYIDKLNDNDIHTEWSRSFNEGREAMEEAIEFLNEVEPLGPLEVSEALCHCAWRHSEFQVETDTMTHTGRDGSSIGDRVDEYGSWNSIVENIVNASENITTGELTILEWVIDDGVPSRGHRSNIFDTDITHFGIGIEGDGDKDYVTYLAVKNFECSEDICNISEDDEDEIGWTQYVLDQQIAENQVNTNDSSNTTNSSTATGESSEDDGSVDENEESYSKLTRAGLMLIMMHLFI